MVDNTDSAHASPEAASTRIDLRPQHLLAAGAGLAVVCAFISDATFLWVLVALGLALGAWKAGQHRTVWPDEVYEALRNRGLTAAQAPRTPRATEPVLPFEPLSIPKVFTTTAKVLVRSWPVMLGIPIALAIAVMTVFYITMKIAMAITFDAQTERVGSVVVSTADYDGGSVFGTLAAMLIVMLIVSVAVAFPSDAFLLGVFVLATHRAVVGKGVRIPEVLREARGRIGSVCRMTAAFYAISLIPDLVLVALLALSPSSLFGSGYVVLSLVLSVGMFVLGILLSFAPLVMMLENQNVSGAFRRSARLAKPALGRLLLIHGLWVVCVIPVTSLSFMFGTSWFMFAVAFGTMIAVFRVLQMVVYLDLKMRQEGYGHELERQWIENTQAVG